jgi:hypothetical protein
MESQEPFLPLGCGTDGYAQDSTEEGVDRLRAGQVKG